MKYNRRVVTGVLVLPLLVLGGVVVLYEWRTVSHGYSSELMWREGEVIAVLTCRDRYARYTVPSIVLGLLQWHTVAGTNAIPITVNEYTIIYHVKSGRLHRYLIDQPSNIIRLTPYQGTFYVMKQNPEKQIWRWEGEVMRELPKDEVDRLFREIPGGYTEAVHREAWEHDFAFDPGSFHEAEKEKVFRFKEGVVTIRLSKQYKPTTGGPPEFAKEVSRRFSIAVDGPFPSAYEDEFITEPRPVQKR